MKFGQLKECNMRSFLEKSFSKCGGKTSPRPFSEKLKLSISLDQQSKDLPTLFSLYGKLRAIEIYQNKAVDHLLSPQIKFFLRKDKKTSGTSLLALFSS